MLDVADTTLPDGSEPGVSHRGKFVTRSHRSVASLTAGLNLATPPLADGIDAKVTAEVTRRGKFITRTYRSASPLTTEVIILCQGL